jgi:integrase/recombinase XerD
VAEAYLQPNKIGDMEKVAGNMRDKLLVRVLFHLGCRINEALALQVKDIDFEAGTVTILHLKTRIRLSCPKCGARLGISHSFCPKCGEKVEEAVTKEQEHRRMRTLPLDKETLEMLHQYIRRGVPVKKGGNDLIFGINRHRAWQIIKELAEKAGLPKLVNNQTGRVHNVSPHRLRDAFAVYAMKMNDSGEGLRMLQEHLGHQSFNTTAHYRKVAREELKHWYDKLWQEKEKADGA